MYTGGAAVGAFLAPIVATTALGFVGFSAAGPVAGSLAAILHSHIGNVAAGSLFALCQSIAMGGHLPAIGYAAGAAVGGAAAGIVAETHSGHEYGVSRNSDEGKGVSQHVQQR
ncbi:hypothetical protein AcW1_004011 [Taiwanofungus camphoratus]|nr:hypothetical protein AcW1_004011 [Antrodia cinnamomea]